MALFKPQLIGALINALLLITSGIIMFIDSIGAGMPSVCHRITAFGGIQFGTSVLFVLYILSACLCGNPRYNSAEYRRPFLYCGLTSIVGLLHFGLGFWMLQSEVRNQCTGRIQLWRILVIIAMVAGAAVPFGCAFLLLKRKKLNDCLPTAFLRFWASIYIISVFSLPCYFLLCCRRRKDHPSAASSTGETTAADVELPNVVDEENSRKNSFNNSNENHNQSSNSTAASKKPATKTAKHNPFEHGGDDDDTAYAAIGQSYAVAESSLAYE